MKPRNHVVLAFIKANKKCGPHEKSAKAKRQQEKIQMKKQGLEYDNPRNKRGDYSLCPT